MLRVRALSVAPGQPSTAAVEERPDPDPAEGSVLVEGLLVGMCGTDVEIAEDGFGIPPPGAERIVLGHESLGRVLEAAGGFAVGDLVAGVVRRPDGCGACAADQWDMCVGGEFLERGIRRADGYGATRWRADPRFLVRLDPALDELGVLLEPTTVVAKAWEQVERIGSRAWWQPRTVLITGAGPIGLLAALLGVQRGLDVHVVDLMADGPKPLLVGDLGATYHSVPVAETGLRPDVVIECTGVSSVVWDCLNQLAPGAVVCLAGISAGRAELDRTAAVAARELLLSNEVVFGTVNAGARHHGQAALALARADPSWLRRLITRRVPLADWPQALERRSGDVKVVVDLRA